MGNLTWYKMGFDEVEQMKNACENDYAKIGELCCALMQTAETGEPVTLSDQILQTAYNMMCVNVRRARSSYEKKCEKRAAAGSKGGKAKAAKRRSETAETADDSEPAFKPPSKTAFKEAVKHFCAERDEKTFDPYTADDLFYKLEKDHWKYYGLKITNKKMVDAIIVAELCMNGTVERDMARTLAKLGRSFTIDDIDNFWDDCCEYNPRTDKITITVNDEVYFSIVDAVKAYFFDEDETDEADDHADPTKPSRDYSSF